MLKICKNIASVKVATIEDYSHNRMDNLHNRVTIKLDKKNKIFYWSQNPKISRIANVVKCCPTKFANMFALCAE